ncbi:MAG: ATP synthase F1 subunit epsilon [Phycisphaerae bacterium]
MANGKTFECSVVTPEKVALRCDAQSVTFPAHDGEVGILKNRAPLICKMGIGVLKIAGPSDSHTLFVDGGFAQVCENQLTLLTEQAIAPDKLQKESAEQALIEARALKVTDEQSCKNRSNAISRAQVQLKMIADNQ